MTRDTIPLLKECIERRTFVRIQRSALEKHDWHRDGVPVAIGARWVPRGH